jgi:hypothetical protein
MPRRELLTSSERLQLLAFPEDEGELIRLYTLTKADLAFVRQHRGDHNRLGIAVMMSYFRYPGRVLAGNERPHGPLLDIVAGQLGIPTDAWAVYAERDATRRSHLLELLPRLGMEQFGTRHYRSISAWLDPTAFTDNAGDRSRSSRYRGTPKAVDCSSAGSCYRTPLCRGDDTCTKKGFRSSHRRPQR